MNIRESAELHWKYTEELIRKSITASIVFKSKENWQNIINNSQILELCEFLYIEAFIHGYKHKCEELNEIH